MTVYYEELGGMFNGFFNRNNYIKVDENYREELVKFITSRNNEDIYKSIYSYSSLDVNESLLKAPLYIDLDMEDIDKASQYDKLKRDLTMVHSYLTNILKVPDNSIAIYFSGHKGFHLLVPQSVFGLNPMEDLNEKYRRIAKNIRKNTLYDTVDTRIYDRRRLFRIANSRHSKTSLYKVPITLKEIRDNDYKYIQQFASQPRVGNKVSKDTSPNASKAFKEIAKKEERRPIKASGKIIYKTNKLLPCVVSILKSGVPDGMRNETTVATSSALFQTGKTKDEVMEIMLEWNKLNDPPMKEGDVKTTVNSAYKMLLDKRGYGCSAFKELDLCVENCNIGG